MILKIGKNKLLYVIYMMFILNVNYSVFNTSHKYIFSGILFLWCLLLVLANIIRNHYDYVFWSGVEGFVIPMIAVTMLSTLSAILIYHTPVRGDYTQSIIRALHYCEAYTIAYFSYKWFGKDCIRLYIVSGLISYSTTVIRFFAYGGIDAFTHLFNTKFNDVTLEVHNLTYILGLFFLYYITSSDYSKKTKKKVRKAMEELNFSPNYAAQSLANRFSKTIGVILPIREESVGNNPFFIQILQGISTI